MHHVHPAPPPPPTPDSSCWMLSSSVPLSPSFSISNPTPSSILPFKHLPNASLPLHPSSCHGPHLGLHLTCITARCITWYLSQSPSLKSTWLPWSSNTNLSFPCFDPSCGSLSWITASRPVCPDSALRCSFSQYSGPLGRAWDS